MENEDRAGVGLAFLSPRLTERPCPGSVLISGVPPPPACCASLALPQLVCGLSVSRLSQGRCPLFPDSPAELALSGKREVSVWAGRDPEQTASVSSGTSSVCEVWLERSGGVFGLEGRQAPGWQSRPPLRGSRIHLQPRRVNTAAGTEQP